MSLKKHAKRVASASTAAPEGRRHATPGKRKNATLSRSSTKGASRADAGVAAFLAKLDHPLKPCITALRKIILGVSPAIVEEIKWNAPSFRTVDHFATMNLRGQGDLSRLMLILHTGAKVKDKVMQGSIPDPNGLLQWLAKDRAMVTFSNAGDLNAKTKPLIEVIQSWIGQL